MLAPYVETSNVNLFLESLTLLLEKPNIRKSSLTIIAKIHVTVLIWVFSPQCA